MVVQVKVRNFSEQQKRSVYTCTAVVPASGLAQVSGDPRRPNEINKYKPARAEDATSGIMLLLGMGLGFAGFLFKARTNKIQLLYNTCIILLVHLTVCVV